MSRVEVYRPKIIYPKPLEVQTCLRKHGLTSRKAYCISLLIFALQHWRTDTDMYDYAFIRFNIGRKQPYGHFYKELSHDIQKIKDLAISGICDLGSKGPLMKDFEILLLPIPLEIWRELLWWMLNILRIVLPFWGLQIGLRIFLLKFKIIIIKTRWIIENGCLLVVFKHKEHLRWLGSIPMV
jgi:hypothetical protein